MEEKTVAIVSASGEGTVFVSRGSVLLFSDGPFRLRGSDGDDDSTGAMKWGCRQQPTVDLTGPRPMDPRRERCSTHRWFVERN